MDVEGASSETTIIMRYFKELHFTTVVCLSYGSENLDGVDFQS